MKAITRTFVLISYMKQGVLNITCTTSVPVGAFSGRWTTYEEFWNLRVAAPSGLSPTFISMSPVALCGGFPLSLARTSRWNNFPDSIARPEAAVTIPVFGLIRNLLLKGSFTKLNTISAFVPSSWSSAVTRRRLCPGCEYAGTSALKGKRENTGLLSLMSAIVIWTGTFCERASYRPPSVATTWKL